MSKAVLKNDPVLLARDLAARSGFSEADVLAWVLASGFQSWADIPDFWNGPLRKFIESRR